MKTIKSIRIYLVMLLLVSGFWSASAQELTPRIRLNYFNENGTGLLRAKITARVGKKYESLADVTAQGFLLAGQEWKSIGTLKSNEDGEMKLTFNEQIQSVIDTLNHLQFKLVIQQDERVKKKEEELEVYKSNLELTFKEEDSLQFILVRFMQPSDSGYLPISEAPINLYVKRMFGRLPFGGDYLMTDENGQAKITFEEKIKGAENGSLTIICSIQDHDQFGTVTVEKVENWGVPRSQTTAKDRSLWAGRQNPPLALLIFPNLALLVIWGYIIYLIINLFRIKKLGES